MQPLSDASEVSVISRQVVANQYRIRNHEEDIYYYVDTTLDLEFGYWHAVISLSSDKGSTSDDAVRSLVDVCRDFVRTYDEQVRNATQGK